MPPLKESNPFNPAPRNEVTDMANSMHERLQELEMQNSQLQGLVVELLNKNEQLRRALAQADHERQA